MKVKVAHLCPWNSPGQNTGVSSLSLLQIFPIQGSNPGLPHHRQNFYQPSHKRSLRILQWVAYPFTSRSCRCRWIVFQLSYQESLPGKPHIFKRVWWAPCSLRPSWLLSTVLWMSSRNEFHSSTQARTTIQFSSVAQSCPHGKQMGRTTTSDGQNSFCIYYLAF